MAADEINYRRFFDVNDLAAIRVEDPRVFEAVHRLVARLLEAGWVTGLRIDHPDGLRDPQAYFKNLQVAVPLDASEQWRTKHADCTFSPKKSSAATSRCRRDWDVCGTTGYDLMNIIGRVQVNAGGLTELRAVYERIIDDTTKPADLVYESRRTVLLSTMASELHMLAAQLYRLAQQHRASRDFTQPALQQALREVLASMTVYRTYARDDSWDISEADYRTITSAVRMAKRRNRTMPHAVFDFIASVLLLEHPPTLTPEQADERRQFALKFQQVSGPDRGQRGRGHRVLPLLPAGIAQRSRRRTRRQAARARRVSSAHAPPHASLASLDVALPRRTTRNVAKISDARLHVLSEVPGEWAQAFARWQEHEPPATRARVDGDAAPDANEEYFIYQTLVGTWPIEPMTEADRDEYRDRILQYLEKALREAKIHTSWMNPVGNVRNRNSRICHGATCYPSDKHLSTTFRHLLRKIADAGFVNSLAQLVLKMTLPGMPDFYRGTELWDFNLVDPDNRRPSRLRRSPPTP